MKKLSVLTVVCGWWLVIPLRVSLAAEEKEIALPELVPISAGEPMAKEFSLAAAARSLDAASLHWQRTKKCATCHTNFAYLLSRSALSPVLPERKEVRGFIEEMVEERWVKVGPRWDAEVVAAAVSLAFHDRANGGKLSPAARKALERLARVQHADGGFDWLKCGWPPMESDDHFGATWAAIGIAAAPEDYAKSEAGRKCLDGIRRWLAAHPAPSLHHRAMLLWASLEVEGILSKEEQRRALDDLLAKELPGGGWAVASLFEGWQEHKRQDNEPQDLKTADGYATGLALYLARRSGIGAGDPRLERGLRWLKENQRASGRWFTRSPTMNSQHYLSNYGTAFAVLALAACGEVPAK